MANAAVDKLKNLTLRYVEKALVGLTAALFLIFTAMAVMKPTVEIKPEQLKSTADAADANLAKQQDPEDILAKLEEEGLKNPEFEKVVENQLAHALNPADYRVKHDWVTPEPGAGLIRDQPELIAPTSLAAFPGRGGILMFTLDDKGERILDTGPEAVKTATRRRNKRNQRNSMMAGMMGGMMGGMPGYGGGQPAEKTEDQKKREALEAERRAKLFAGKAAPADEAKDAEDPALAGLEPQGPWKEETKGKRWVVITGVLDNEQLMKNYLKALKTEAIAYPNYKRLDVERQTHLPDGTWTEWAGLDQDKNYEVLDNLPEEDEEFVPDTMRPVALNDPLPFLRAGYWTGVHVASLVPAELREPPKNNGMAGMGMPGMAPGMGMPGMAPGMGMRGRGGMMQPGMGMPGMGMPGKGGSGGMMQPGMMQPGMGMPGMGMPGMGMGGGGSLNPDETNFPKTDEKTVMIRAIDFTVDPDTSYRYRLRVVVNNPNKGHTDVNPGVDVESDELKGPWSEATQEIAVPADVAAYAQAPVQTERRHDLVSFQVVKWDPNTGQTVMKNDEAGPGEIVGEYGSVQMPSSEGDGAKSVGIDFNSRAVVLDTVGGRERLPDIGVERNPFEVPALAMVVQADGSVVIRNQALDKTNEVRQDMEANYNQAIKDSGKKREEGGSRYPGMSMPGGR